ncbi:hypothetical protein MesoLj113b_68750 (plasmid) [Mesorhizobium sp. 113-3-3]|nr:hypothetical protein MesoLj113b_68750 [Mesorhizobium sp. 113-3-3]
MKGIGVLVCRSFKWPDTLGSKFEVIQVDKDNLDALICECARQRTTHDIAGATGTQGEFYATVCKLCQYLKLPGPDPVSVERCVVKPKLAETRV